MDGGTNSIAKWGVGEMNLNVFLVDQMMATLIVLASGPLGKFAPKLGKVLTKVAPRIVQAISLFSSSTDSSVANQSLRQMFMARLVLPIFSRQNLFGLKRDTACHQYLLEQDVLMCDSTKPVVSTFRAGFVKFVNKLSFVGLARVPDNPRWILYQDVGDVFFKSMTMLLSDSFFKSYFNFLKMQCSVTEQGIELQDTSVISQQLYYLVTFEKNETVALSKLRASLESTIEKTPLELADNFVPVLEDSANFIGRLLGEIDTEKISAKMQSVIGNVGQTLTKIGDFHADAFQFIKASWQTTSVGLFMYDVYQRIKSLQKSSSEKMYQRIFISASLTALFIHDFLKNKEDSLKNKDDSDVVKRFRLLLNLYSGLAQSIAYSRGYLIANASHYTTYVSVKNDINLVPQTTQSEIDWLKSVVDSVKWRVANMRKLQGNKHVRVNDMTSSQKEKWYATNICAAIKDDDEFDSLSAEIADLKHAYDYFGIADGDDQVIFRNIRTLLRPLIRYKPTGDQTHAVFNITVLTLDDMLEHHRMWLLSNVNNSTFFVLTYENPYKLDKPEKAPEKTKLPEDEIRQRLGTAVRTLIEILRKYVFKNVSLSSWECFAVYRLFETDEYPAPNPDPSENSHPNLSDFIFKHAWQDMMEEDASETDPPAADGWYILEMRYKDAATSSQLDDNNKFCKLFSQGLLSSEDLRSIENKRCLSKRLKQSSLMSSQ